MYDNISGGGKPLVTDAMVTYLIAALIHDLLCQTAHLPVLEGFLPVIGDKEDPVIRYRFLTVGCPDVHVIWLEDDVRADHPRAIVLCALITIPDLDFAGIKAVIVPVLLQEFVAG